jgi:hypothetical protein
MADISVKSYQSLIYDTVANVAPSAGHSSITTTLHYIYAGTDFVSREARNHSLSTDSQFSSITDR